MVQIREIAKTKVIEKGDKSSRPTIIKWKGVSMIRSHSLQACVKEILQASQSQDVVQVNIIGDPSSGKTVLGKAIQHLIHILSEKMKGPPYSVRVFEKEDLLDFETTLKTLTPANYVLLFDDLSFLGAIANKKQIEMVKQAITEIRHLEGGQDVKIIIIKVFHYTLGLDKYLRQNDFSFFTSVGSSEDENMEKIVGGKNMPKVRAFKQMRTRIKIAPEGHKKFSYKLKDGKPPFTYPYRQPFQPELFWNNDTLRNVVSPTREWIEPICSICSQFGNKRKFESAVDINKFMEETGKQYSPSILKAAVVSILSEHGIEVAHPGVVSAKRFIKRCMMENNLKLEDLSTYYGFKPTRTAMRKDYKAIMKLAKMAKKPKKSENFDEVENSEEITKTVDDIADNIEIEEISDSAKSLDLVSNITDSVNDSEESLSDSNLELD